MDENDRREIYGKMASNRIAMKQRWEKNLSLAAANAAEAMKCLENASKGLSEADLTGLIGTTAECDAFFLVTRERLPRIVDQLKMWAA